MECEPLMYLSKTEKYEPHIHQPHANSAMGARIHILRTKHEIKAAISRGAMQ